MKNMRRTKYLGTGLQNKLLFVIFASAVIPATIVAVGMYYLIFNLLAWQIVIPEIISSSIIPVLRKVNLIVAIVVPIALLVIWFIALELSHRITGPIYRMEKELDQMISQGKQSTIKLRKKDEFQSLVAKLNKLLNK